MRKRYWVVWTADGREGFITERESDAIAAATGVGTGFGQSELADAFRDLHGDNGEAELAVQAVDIPPLG